MLRKALALTIVLAMNVGLRASTAAPRLERQQTSDGEVARDPQPKANSSPVAAPNPDAAGTYQVRDGVSAPKVVYAKSPKYTFKARLKKVTGICVIAMIVDPQGMPRDVHVIRSIESSVDPTAHSAAKGLDANALDAVKQYRFEPATYQGKPVPVEVNVEVNFRVY